MECEDLSDIDWSSGSGVLYSITDGLLSNGTECVTGMEKACTFAQALGSSTWFFLFERTETLALPYALLYVVWRDHNVEKGGKLRSLIGASVE